MKKVLMSGLIISICIFSVVTFTLAGCKAATTETTTATTAAAAETTAAASETTAAASETTAAGTAVDTTEGKLKVIYFRPEDKAVNEAMTKLFNEKHPNVAVTLEATPGDQYPEIAVNNILAGADGADIFLSWMGPNSKAFYDAGGMLDLSDWDLLKKVPQSAWDQLGIAFKNPKVGVPIGAGGFEAFYNMDTLEKYGLQIPKTWEELLVVCDKLLANGVTPMQVGGKDHWPMELFFAQLESNYRKAPLDNGYLDMKNIWGPAAAQFKELWDKKYLDQASFGLDYATVEANFAAGKFPIYIGLTFFLGSIKKMNPTFKMDIDVAPLNKPGNPPRMCVYFDPMWSINAKTKNVDLAKAWIQNYVDNYDLFIKESLWLPLYPVKDVASIDPLLGKEQELLKAYENVINYGVLYLPDPSVQQVHTAGLQDYFIGKTTLEQYETTVKDAYDKAVEKAASSK
jgi:raffinose/stachyose/melibiose transport system substrate-binding protein